MSTQPTILVTGGSRGLGRAMVHRFVRDGARVLFTWRSDRDAAAEVQRASEGRATAIQADLATLDGVRSLFDQVDRQLGSDRLHGVVANAGIIEGNALDDVDEAAFDRLFDVNVKGVFFTAQQAVRRMADGGRVVFLGSGLTRFAMDEYLVYSGAKSALDGFALVLAHQLGQRRITVNVLAPGAIATDMNPWLHTEQGAEAYKSLGAIPRVGQPDDIADVAAFLMSDDSRWVTGQRIEASGGMKL